MNEWNEAKKSYEEVPVPEELAERVQTGIQQGRVNRRRRFGHRLAGTAAACLVVAFGVLNSSPTVAAAAADVPVLGGLFQILTVRSYEVEENQAHYKVDVPEIEADSELAQRVNQEIQSVVDQHITEMTAMWEEYHEAFIATGGTEEEWAQRTMDVIVDYDIKYQTDTTVSFVVDLSQCAVFASQTRYYYNLDLEHDRSITLEEVLGEDWITRCNTSIRRQIAESADADGFSYFFPEDEGGFSTVDETTSFYIQTDGTPVVVYPEYSIAAGAAGIVEFPID